MYLRYITRINKHIKKEKESKRRHNGHMGQFFQADITKEIHSNDLIRVIPKLKYQS